MMVLFMSITVAKAATPVKGTIVATADQLCAFALQHTTNEQSVTDMPQIAQAFVTIGAKYGIRGDIAFCQSIIETGWFNFTGGTAMTPADHNYCGLGCTSLGVKGNTFNTIEIGVEAQLQHLWAYCCTDDLPSWATLYDERFKWVSRGVAPNWEDYGSGIWAAGAGYGDNIMTMYNNLIAFSQPSLTASPTSISLTGAQGETVSKTVTVTGKFLSSSINVNPSNPAFIVTKGSDWNNTTGGTLTISLDTSLAANTYTGYVAVQSGSYRVEINCNGTVTGPPSTDPTLNVSTTSVNLTGESGGTAPSTTVNVTGANLTSDISYTSSNDAFKVTTNNWNATTGGTLSISLDTSKAIGTYNGTITVTSGSLTKTITCTGTITEATPDDGTPSLTATPASLTFNAVSGTSPSQTVKITGKNLTSNIGYNSVTQYLVVTKGSDWNDLTGGTLTITLDTSIGVGTHTGKYVAVVSGNNRIEIQCPITVTTQAATPTLSASQTSVTLSAEEGATAPSQNVTIIGANLTSDISYTSSNDAFKVTTSNWNASTGGTLTISLDTSKAAGSYSGTVSVKSGSTSVIINCNGTITARTTGGEDEDTASLTASPASLTFNTPTGTNPSQTVKITGKNLTSSISVNNSSSRFTFVKGADWNDLTGGSLIITFNAGSLSVGEHSGYVAAQSGTNRVEINCTGTVTEQTVVLTPSLSVSESAISLNAEEGAASPNKSLTVTGENLTSDITYTSSNDAFKLTTSNWNARTGGTLTISLDTSKAAGSYNGTVTLTSGNLTKTISCTGTITAKAVVPPTISASVSSLSFSAEQGSVSPTKEVKITAANLNHELTANSINSKFIVTKGSDWNVMTGGTLFITTDTSLEPGTHTGYVAVASNDEARVQIDCTSTITEANKETTGGIGTFGEVWNQSTIAGNATANNWDATTIRNMAYGNGKLYCVYNHSSILVLDAQTGNYLSQLPTDYVLTGGTLTLCDVAYIDGHVVACNLATSSKGEELRIYAWDSDTSLPYLLYSTTDLKGAARLGDCMEIYGSWKKGMRIAFGNDDGTTTRIVEFTCNDDNWITNVVNATSNGTDYLHSGTSTRVYPASNGYWIDGKSILPTRLNTSGVQQEAFSGESCTWGNDFAQFSFDGKDYMMVATYLAKTGNYTEGLMRLYDVTNGLTNGAAVIDCPENGLGATKNTNTTGSVEINVGSTFVEAWVLTTTQGIAYYKMSNGEEEPENPDIPDNPNPGTGDSSLPGEFTTDWVYSEAEETSASWMNPSEAYTRNMVMKGDNLYVVQRSSSDANIKIVNAYSGQEIGTLPSGDLDTNEWKFASVANMGGTIIACNLASSRSSYLKVYRWDSDTSEPVEILSTRNHGARAGDLMCATGTINDGKLYFASNGTTYRGRLYVYTIKDGKASSTTPQTINLRDEEGDRFDFGGGMAVIEVRVMEDGTIWATGKNGLPTHFEADGTFIKSLGRSGVNSNIVGTAFDQFTYGEHKLAAVTTYASEATQGYLNLIDITNGVESPTVLHSFPVLGANGVSNGTFVNSAISAVEGKDIHLWVLIPNQGAAKYTASPIQSSIETIDGALAEPKLAINNGNITLQGAEVAEMIVVTATGLPVAQSNCNEVETDHLNSGIYIVVATLTDGSRISTKFVKR